MGFLARTGANGKTLPPVTLNWSQGLPAILAERGIDPKLIKDRNNLLIGSDGMLLRGFESWQLLAEETFADVKQAPQSLPPTPGFYKD